MQHMHMPCTCRAHARQLPHGILDTRLGQPARPHAQTSMRTRTDHALSYQPATGSSNHLIQHSLLLSSLCVTYSRAVVMGGRCGTFGRLSGKHAPPRPSSTLSTPHPAAHRCKRRGIPLAVAVQATHPDRYMHKPPTPATHTHTQRHTRCAPPLPSLPGPGQASERLGAACAYPKPRVQKKLN